MISTRSFQIYLTDPYSFILSGARPVPMTRRSSFPALPLNPDVQAMMLGHRQASVDSDDEDGRGRRVRILRRF